ncbi:MAG TPA: DUF6036 family nucleotidyltransferase [Gemmatimonadaceae bacterium]|nr:DUF6036 family nucleotidyltransferase [Gemmatimonadaceae bacterium]
MRGQTDRSKLERFMASLGERVRGDGTVFLTGGATAVLFGWRSATIDVDIKADPEPAGLFEAIAALKDEFDVNVELASPDHFIPPVPGWRERSIPIAQHGHIAFFHYDPYGQALSKILRGHERDIRDVRALLRDRLVTRPQLWKCFESIEPELVRYPAVDRAQFRETVRAFVSESGGQ